MPKRRTRRHPGASDARGPIDTAPGAEMVEVPAADPEWHPVAARWFASLATSGQAVYYEPSDWMTAYLVAESMSRTFHQPEPPKGATITAWLRAMTGLLVTEVDRRRARLELERPDPDAPVAPVDQLDDYRDRLGPKGHR